jgi:hypothetical protein
MFAIGGELNVYQFEILGVVLVNLHEMEVSPASYQAKYLARLIRVQLQ